MAALQKIPAPEVLRLFIEHLRGERRLADKTCEAYQRDIAEFLGFLTGHLEALKIIDTPLDSPGEPWIAVRNQAVLALCYGSGLRISEALSITGRDVPLARQIQLTGKGGKTRVVPILPPPCAAP